MDARPIAVTVNGERREVPAGTSVAALLAALLVRPETVAVERNRAVVRRRDHASALLLAGDEIEVVTFVGGG